MARARPGGRRPPGALPGAPLVARWGAGVGACLAMLLPLSGGGGFAAPGCANEAAGRRFRGCAGGPSDSQHRVELALRGPEARGAGGRAGGLSRRRDGRVPRTTGRAVAERVAAPVAAGSGLTLSRQGFHFAAYFWLQVTMGLSMKWLLSQAKVAADLAGVPASFLVISCQQLVCFGLFIMISLGTRLVGRPYQIKRLASRRELLLVLGLSLSFTLNIGLNLLSLSLIPLSLYMILRGCSPVVTALLQTVVMRSDQRFSAGEWICMLCGVAFAGAAVVAQGGGAQGAFSTTYLFGVAVCLCSLTAGACDFVLKGLLGNSAKMNPLDTIAYTALPIAAQTAAIGALVAKPVTASWAARFAPRMTDLAVFRHLWQVNPPFVLLIWASGAFAFVFNLYVNFLVVELSPATIAFAGNFNKAATILGSLLLLEGGLPVEPRGWIVLAAVAGNIGVFALYAVLRRRRLARAP